MIPYGKQDINIDDIEAVVDVLKSDFLTQSSALLGQVEEKKSKSKAMVDDLIKQAYANVASLAA